MSRLWPKSRTRRAPRPVELRFHLAPARIICTALAGQVRPRAVGLRSWDCPVDTSPGMPAWQTAADTLAAVFKTLGPAPRVSILLSAHFCRHMAFESPPQLKHAPEILAYARHRMQGIYGPIAADWDFRVSTTQHTSLVSAMDGALLSRLREIFALEQPRLASVQPHFSHIANVHRQRIGDRSGWIVAAEPGSLTMGLIVRGQWQHLAVRRADLSEAQAIPEAVDRERHLMGTEDDHRHIWLHKEYGVASPPRESGYDLELLPDPDAPTEPGGAHAMAA